MHKLKELQSEWREEQFFNGQYSPRKSTLRLFVQFVAGAIHWEIAPIICKMVGHRCESDDWATPDSGGMGFHCNRCYRYGAEHILY